MTRPGGTVITPAVLREWPLPGVEGGKESHGRALVVGGSVQNPGALILAAEASLRAGAGKSQVVAPDPVAVPIGVAVPEALVQGGPVAGSGDLAPGASGFVAELCPEAEAVLIGPGLLDPAGAADLVAACVPHVSSVLVLDALGLAWVTPDPSRVRDFAGRCVLSPNLAELALVLGEDADAVEADQAGATLRLAAATGAVVTSGGTTTWIATPEGALWRAEDGGPGLGVSGSGDVKAGIVLGLCARGADPAQAAVWGAYLHGAIGGRLASRYGPYGYLSRELPAEIPQALLEVAR
ncbi:NAD(P)H-hydrate dehydratase [Propioniciclava sp. MC1595]|uniref:NAD(P)H-hydrate dehydratase n=1 Tax=Propioniciclava sp. MC1595 TaxID=2760308 RepID=UPI00166224D5|nr:NAD(P)H-hydrate dehydratase [Propioniciclava sp. MC1595]MBB1496012.1 NAD(P)H-hydrate dehydratase [Propioniciclava sp. MC1595]QTE26544.1 NAD(P)H-hydrate dehydratase [Propioniciclava sp. MC1595]